MEIWSSMALTASGWQNDVTLTIEDNVIVGLEANTKKVRDIKLELLCQQL